MTSQFIQGVLLPGWLDILARPKQTVFQEPTNPQSVQQATFSRLSHRCYVPPASIPVSTCSQACYLLALRGVMLKGGPGRPSTFGNRSIHICSFPCKDPNSSFMFYACMHVCEHAHTHIHMCTRAYTLLLASIASVDVY